jgi:nuclease-like protein
VNRETGSEEDETGPLPPVEAKQEARGLVRAPRPILGALAGDPRLPIWIGRAAMAAVVGIAVLVWQGWRLALTAAALVAIIDTIYRSRTTSVVPAGIRVTSAQRRTKRRLFLLRPAGYVALHRRAIPGSDSVIDHLVIGPGGVFAVDSERWDRRLPVRSVSAGMLYHGPFSQKDRLRHASWEATQAAGLLSKALGEPITVRPAMAIYGPTIPWIVATLDGVDVFSGRRVGKYFRRQSRAGRANRLDAGQVEDIQVAAAMALPPAH